MSWLTARPTLAGRAGRSDHGISAPFGRSPQYFNGTRDHHGQDYYWLNADPARSRRVSAAGVGTVSRVYWDDTMGGCIEVNHGSFMSRYCHMPRGSAAVSVGQQVNDQTYLGPMGNAGTAANGQYHLHFEVWKDGVRVDPEPYFRALDPTQRAVVSPAGANVRTGASTAPPVVTVLKGGTVVTMLGFEHGGTAAGSDLWFKHAAGYSHVSGFTDRGTHDLADLTPAPPVEPEPTPEPSPPVEVPPVPEPEPLPDPETPAEPGTVPPPETPPEKTEKPTDTWPVWQAIAAVIGTAILGVISWVAGWWT